MSNFENLLFSEKLKLVEKIKNRNVYEISSEFEISRRSAYLYKFRFINFSQIEISKIDQLENVINQEILCALSFYEVDIRHALLENFNIIAEAINPFDKMDEIISSSTPQSPLASLSNKYWKTIAEYLNQRGIDNYPFTKKTIYFINSIGVKGFEKQSDGQKKWILGLLSVDKKGAFDLNEIFTNEILLEKGLKQDYLIIKDFMKCL